MKSRSGFVTVWLMVAAAGPSGCFDNAAPETEPETGTGLWHLEGLPAVRAKMRAEAPEVMPAAARAIRSADGWLKEGPWSVMDKTRVADSGDKHDYISLAPYWWPDPSKPGGMPYMRRDGMTNPERDTNAFDYTAMNDLTDAVGALGLAYYLTQDHKYSAHAARLLRTWFLDAQTRMNPRLEYAQAVPGVSAGRPEGVLDTLEMARMLDGVELLRGAPEWTPADEAALEAWFTEYLQWLRTSAIAREEEDADNNHGTWYDVQATRLALFVGRDDIARELVEAAKTRRIAAQIEPDGRQPEELSRTKTFDYSMYNLRAFIDLATLARGVDVDLFGYVTDDGRSIRKALDFMMPYTDPTNVWPLPQITAYKYNDYIGVLRRAGIAYRAEIYEQALQKHFASTLPAHIIQLVYPAQTP